MTTPNNSTAAGYLAPIGTAPPEDGDLEDLIQPIIVGITGLDGALVIPSWQAQPPLEPDRTVTWCSFGVAITGADTNATMTHDGCANGGLGTSTYSRTEFLEVRASFYGPACRSYATLLRDGFGIGQNRDALRSNGMAYVAMDRITNVPEFRNTQIIRRVDLVISLRRMVSRTYNIQNITSVQGQIVVDSGGVAARRIGQYRVGIVICLICRA